SRRSRRHRQLQRGGQPARAREASAIPPARSVKAAAAFAVLLLSSCAQRPTPPPAIDQRLASLVPFDASAIVGFRPAALGSIAAPFGTARYVLTSVRGAEV